MALDYYLTIQNPANEITPEQVRKALAAAFSLQTHEISGILMAPGLSVNVFKEDDEYEASLFGTPYPDVCVAFHEMFFPFFPSPCFPFYGYSGKISTPYRNSETDV